MIFMGLEKSIYQSISTNMLKIKQKNCYKYKCNYSQRNQSSFMCVRDEQGFM